MDKVNAIFNTLVTPRNNSGRSKIVSKLTKPDFTNEMHSFMPISAKLFSFDKMIEHQKAMGSN